MTDANPGKRQVDERIREIITAELRRWNFSGAGIEKFWLSVDQAVVALADSNGDYRCPGGGDHHEPLAGGKPHPILPPAVGSDDAQDARDEHGSSVTARRDGHLVCRHCGAVGEEACGFRSSEGICGRCGGRLPVSNGDKRS